MSAATRHFSFVPTTVLITARGNVIMNMRTTLYMHFCVICPCICSLCPGMWVQLTWLLLEMSNSTGNNFISYFRNTATCRHIQFTMLTVIFQKKLEVISLWNKFICALFLWCFYTFDAFEQSICVIELHTLEKLTDIFTIRSHFFPKLILLHNTKCIIDLLILTIPYDKIFYPKNPYELKKCTLLQ